MRAAIIQSYSHERPPFSYSGRHTLARVREYLERTGANANLAGAPTKALRRPQACLTLADDNRLTLRSSIIEWRSSDQSYYKFKAPARRFRAFAIGEAQLLVSGKRNGRPDHGLKPDNPQP
jgi:hypothetical protein